MMPLSGPAALTAAANSNQTTTSPPLNELDPHGLIWGISNKEETAEEGEDLFGGGPLG